MRRKTIDQFIQEAKTVHGDKYNYYCVEYINEDTQVKIWCNTCNEFFYQTPRHHLKKCGCQKCAQKRTNDATRLSLKIFIERSITVHDNKYNYDNVEYINNNTKVKIYCNKCKKFFEQTPYHHMRGVGCPYCNIQNRRKSQDTFISELKTIFGNKYIFDNTIYKNNRTKVKIYCKTCKRDFFCTPDCLLNKKQGCPYCSPVSKGEEYIKKWLINNNINFIRQKRFTDCRDKNPLPFDFYLPDYNLCIEFQGQQHYRPSMFITLNKSKEKGLKQFDKQKLHDKIKKDFCKNKHIILLEIKYNDNINKVLNKTIINKKE